MQKNLFWDIGEQHPKIPLGYKHYELGYSESKKEISHLTLALFVGIVLGAALTAK